MAFSSSSIFPSSIPSSISKLTSSSVISCFSLLFSPSILSNRFVESLSSFTIGADIRDNVSIELATLMAILSGLLIAICLGAISPTIRVKYVVISTIIM